MKKIHGGDIYSYNEMMTDFSANINPLGIQKEIMEAAVRSLACIDKYPDVENRELKKALSEHEGVKMGNIICGAGASEIIFNLAAVIKPRKALFPAPTFAEYELSCNEYLKEKIYYYLKEENEFEFDNDIFDYITDDLDIMFICNPNNPTGKLINRQLILDIAKECLRKKIYLVVDECFLDFTKNYNQSLVNYIKDYPNMIVIKAFTKMYAIPGLRLGYGICQDEKLLDSIYDIRQPWNISVVAGKVGVAALKLNDLPHKTREYVKKEREYLENELSKLKIKVFGGEANYLLLKSDTMLDRELKKHNILIRNCDNYTGLTKGFYRIAVNNHKDNEKLVKAFSIISGQKEGIHMAKVIMVQGTMSNAGKSLLTAGLCRVFKQDGYKVAPFKSQNMALNSFITDDGLEMGRAQVVQAEAAGIRPSVEMNPILLKPTNDCGSQVIVNGEVVGTMSAKEYYEEKSRFIPDILKAYEKLAKENDIIVVEGAGSPAEINLKDGDIVNMGLAKMLEAPVLLVGDIDRGGVFAQLVGTLMLLEEDEKALIKGLVVNKFRGDKEILAPGLDMLEEKCGKPVVGVMPYLYLDIDDEDSLTERFSRKGETGLVDIAVIRTPRISNFTDFNALECIDGVSVRYVNRVADLKNPDVIMLPGTKNTIDDLLWIRKSGFEARIKQHAAQGKIVFGVCGGYQMLGETITDPEGQEHRGQFRGIGLLPIKTVFRPSKTRTRVTGVFSHLEGILKELEGQTFEGYEIHMGESEFVENSTGSYMNKLKPEGIDTHKDDGVSKGNVYGSYVHGIFDYNNVAAIFVSAVLRSKGLDDSNVKTFDMEEYKEKQYDALAQAIRDNLDMPKIYEILINE